MPLSTLPGARRRRFFRRLHGTFNPWRTHSRCTRFAFTRHPSCRSSAAIRRYP
jgi:hypothetical protein